MYDEILQAFDLSSQDIRTYSPLALAFMGDSVYEIIIRSYLLGQGSRSSAKLSSEKAQLVKAHSQRLVVDAIISQLSEEEADVLRRGRNANPKTHAKNASLEDYRIATGLETLCGYMYLKGDMDRLIELIHSGLAKADLLK